METKFIGSLNQENKIFYWLFYLIVLFPSCSNVQKKETFNRDSSTLQRSMNEVINDDYKIAADSIVFGTSVDTMFSGKNWSLNNVTKKVTNKITHFSKSINYNNKIIIRIEYDEFYTVESPVDYGFKSRKVTVNNSVFDIDSVYENNKKAKMPVDIGFGGKDMYFYKGKSMTNFYLILFPFGCDGDLCYEVLALKFTVLDSGIVNMKMENKHLPKFNI